MRSVISRVEKGLAILLALEVTDERLAEQGDYEQQAERVDEASLCVVSRGKTIRVNLNTSGEPAVAEVEVLHQSGARTTWTERLFCVACDALIDGKGEGYDGDSAKATQWIEY